jgi:hypothetical protein
MAVIRLAGVLAAAVLATQPAAAQGLAGAASQAQQERKANESAGMRVTKLSVSPLDGDLQEPQLTTALFDQYALARAAVGRAFHRDWNLRDRVRDRVAELKRGRDAAAVYESEPKLKDAIEFHGFTVRGFMDVVITLQRAGMRGHAEKREQVLSPVQNANTAFVKQNAHVLRALEHKLSTSDAWLLFSPNPFIRY